MTGKQITLSIIIIALIIIVGELALAIFLSEPIVEAQPETTERYLGGDTLKVFELIVEDKDRECMIIVHPNGIAADCWEWRAYPKD